MNPVRAIVKSIVTIFGPEVSYPTRATVIDRNGVGSNDVALTINPETVIGYLPYTTRAEIIRIHEQYISLSAQAVSVSQTSLTDINLSSTPEFQCEYDSYTTNDCGDLLQRFSQLATQGSEETAIVFTDSGGTSFSLPLRVWYPSRVWYEVSDYTLNRVSGWLLSDCATELYQQTRFRVWAEYTTGERTSSPLDVTRFNLPTDYDASIIQINGDTLRGEGVGSAIITVTASQNVSYTGPAVYVVDDVISPLTSFPIVFTESYVSLSQETFDRGSTIVATASVRQLFDAAGVRGQATTSVYFTDGSRYDPPAYELNAVSSDVYVVSTSASGVVTATADGIASVSVDWIPQTCSSQSPLISDPASVSVQLPFPVELVASPLTVLRESQDVNIASVPFEAFLDVSLLYSDGTLSPVQSTDEIQFSSSPTLNVAYDSISDEIKISAVMSSVESNVALEISYQTLSTTVPVAILDVVRLQSSLLPYPNEAAVEVGFSHIDLEQIGSTGLWQQAELVVQAAFSDGSVERISNPSLIVSGENLFPPHITLSNNRFISGSFGTTTITSGSGQLQSNIVTVTILDDVIAVEKIVLDITEMDRTSYQYTASVQFVDGTLINDVTAFSNEKGVTLVTFDLLPAIVGSIEVSSGIITIDSSHYELVTLTGSLGDFSNSTTFTANLEPGVGELDLGSPDGIPLPPVALGETFTFDLRVNTDWNPIEALDVVVTYDRTALELVAVAPLVGFSNARSNNPVGEVQLTVLAPAGTTVTSQIPSVANFTFRALAEGLSSISAHRYLLKTVGLSTEEQATVTAMMLVGTSVATVHRDPEPTERSLYLPSALTFDHLDVDDDGYVDIIDAFDVVTKLGAGDFTDLMDNDANLDQVINIRDVVYLSRVATGLAAVLDSQGIIQPAPPQCLLTVRQSFFSFGDIQLFLVISHPDIALELNVSQAFGGSIIYIDDGGSGVFELNEDGEFVLELYTPLDIRSTPIGLSLGVQTLDDFGSTSPERTFQFIGGQNYTFVGDGELIPRIEQPPLTIGERDGFSPLTAFTIDGLRSDYCSFNGSQLSTELEESVIVDSVVYNVSAVRTDLGFPSRSEQYSITSESNPGVFTIQPNGGLTLSSDLDFESQKEYTLTVEGETLYDDGSSAVYSATLNILVLDVNDEYPQFTNITVFSSELLESVGMGYRVAIVEAFDGEAGSNGEIYFELESSSDPFDQFSLAQDGNSATLTVGSGLDRETNSTYNLTVLAIDRGIPPLTSSTTIDITILDVNDNPPMFSQPSYTINVPEETLDWSYTITVSDLDFGPNGAVTLTLGYEGPQLFNISNDGVLTLVVPLDHELIDSYSFTVTAVDGGPTPHPPQSVIVTVIVTDINDNTPSPSLITELPILVEDDSENGALVAEVIAEDLDVGVNAEITFELLDPDLPFRIDPLSGVVTLSRSLDVDEQSEYSVTVVARDGGNPSRAGSISFTVYAIEGQIVSFDTQGDGFLVKHYSKPSPRRYSQQVGYLLNENVGTPVRVEGNVNIVTEAQDVVELPNIGGSPAYVEGALLQREVFYSQKTIVAFVQVFDIRSVIAEPTAVRVRVQSDVSTLEGSCTTLPDLGYCIVSLDIPDSWFVDPATKVTAAHANFLTAEDDGVEIGLTLPDIIPSPAYTTDFNTQRVLLLPPAHNVLPSRNFSAEVFVVTPIVYESYNRVEFDLQTDGASFLSVSSDEQWECSKSIA